MATGIWRTALTRCLLAHAQPGGVRLPAGRCLRAPVARLIVLAQGDLPTTAIYFGSRGNGTSDPAVEIHNVEDIAPGMLRLDPGCAVVVVRHLPVAWLDWLARNESEVAGIVYFMDDDMPAAFLAGELPWTYGLKTLWRFVRTWRRLRRSCGEVWLSTPELASRHRRMSPRLLQPLYVPAPGGVTAGEGPSVYFYHGSWAHRAEIAWLVPVVRAIQQRCPQAWFEIIGTDAVRDLFAGVPRVRVVAPMPWPDYLARAGSVRYQVGLAPCLDTPFNRARSHAKLFDITRLGAAGIYSQVAPYADAIEHGVNGLLCANREEAWVEAACRLLADGDLRATLHAEASRRCLAALAAADFPVPA